MRVRRIIVTIVIPLASCLIAVVIVQTIGSAVRGEPGEVILNVGSKSGVGLRNLDAIDEKTVAVALERKGAAERVLVGAYGARTRLCKTNVGRGSFSISPNGHVYSAMVGNPWAGEKASTVVRETSGKTLYGLDIASPGGGVLRVLDDGSAVVLRRRLAEPEIEVTLPVVADMAFTYHDSTGRTVSRIPEQGFLPTQAHAISGNGLVLAVSCAEGGAQQVRTGCVRVYQTTSGKELYRLPFSAQIAISSDGAVVALGGDGGAKLESSLFRDGVPIAQVGDTRGALTLSRNGRFLLAGDSWHRVFLYDGEKQRSSWEVRVSEDKLIVIYGVADNGLSVISVCPMKSPTDGLRTTELRVYSGDGVQLLTRVLWAPTEAPDMDPIADVAITSSGRTILVATGTGKILRLVVGD
jgi:hypothetical protein